MGVRLLKALSSSLGVRLLIPLLAIVAAGMTIHSFVSFQSTKKHFLRFVSAEADRSSGLIMRATHDGMLLNRMNDVQSTIERLAQEPDVAAIRVYDKHGTIVLSSERSELGRRVSTPCSQCHARARTRATASQVARSSDARVVRQLSVIRKEEGCIASGCHNKAATQSVLGVLDVEMSLLPLDNALKSAREQMIWTTLALLLLIGVIATIIVRRLIHEPITELKQATRRVAEGDLATRIDVRSAHELGLLAHDFNRMAEDLSRSRQEVLEWSETLEQKVAEETAQLEAAQRQVLHMEKMASLGKLSATVAHELNNPISGMLTYARLIERELFDQPMDAGVRKEIDRYLHLVQRECSRCGHIVQNLLVFARRSNTELRRINLNEILDRSLMLIRHHLEISHIRLHTHPLSGDNTLVADADQLQQAFVALLVNAVEAMPDGGDLTIHLSGDADEVVIEITDTGAGIPPEIQALIFEPFFTTKNKESGSGLGLAVVYGIVHRHDGTITVRSQVGRGTTFSMRFPRKEVREA